MITAKLNPVAMFSKVFVRMKNPSAVVLLAHLIAVPLESSFSTLVSSQLPR